MPLLSSAAVEVPTKMEEGFGMLNFARRQIMPQAKCGSSASYHRGRMHSALWP